MLAAGPRTKLHGAAFPGISGESDPVGGVAQLALLGGNPAAAFRVGFVPFLTGDLLKIGLAAVLILAAGPKIRSLL